MKRGKGDLEGNQSSQFLDSMPKLESALYKIGGDVLIPGLQLVAVGQAMKKVQDSCLGMDLIPGWKQSISNFSTIYRQSGLSITPKVSFKRIVHRVEQ